MTLTPYHKSLLKSGSYDPEIVALRLFLQIKENNKQALALLKSARITNYTPDNLRAIAKQLIEAK